MSAGIFGTSADGIGSQVDGGAPAEPLHLRRVGAGPRLPTAYCGGRATGLTYGR
jgi:hypothetical protein